MTVENYDARDYPPFAVAVDLAVFTIRDGALKILLVQRADDPFGGAWALPGGFVGEHEDATTAAWRELGEETGISSGLREVAHGLIGGGRAPLLAVEGPVGLVVESLRAEGLSVHRLNGGGEDESACRLARSQGTVVVGEFVEDFPEVFRGDVQRVPAPLYLEPLRAYASPERDPRMRVVSLAHVAFAPGLAEPVAGSDATWARWWSVEDVTIGELPLAFDHHVIVRDALERVRSKLEYTTLATRFVAEPFTLAELRSVYTSVWGAAPELADFRRKVLSVDGFVVPTDGTTDGSAGRPALLYRRGPATQMQPAMMRPEGGGLSVRTVNLA